MHKPRPTVWNTRNDAAIGQISHSAPIINWVISLKKRCGGRRKNIPIITIKRKATMKATPESRDGEEGMHGRMVEERRIKIRRTISFQKKYYWTLKRKLEIVGFCYLLLAPTVKVWEQQKRKYLCSTKKNGNAWKYTRMFLSKNGGKPQIPCSYKRWAKWRKSEILREKNRYGVRDSSRIGVVHKHCQRHSGPRNWLRDLD